MGLGDGSVEVWDYVQSQKRLAWRAHTGPGAKIRGVIECESFMWLWLPFPVRALCYHPSQPLLATGGDDGRVKVWPANAMEITRVKFRYQENLSLNLRIVSVLPGTPTMWGACSSQPCTHGCSLAAMTAVFVFGIGRAGPAKHTETDHNKYKRIFWGVAILDLTRSLLSTIHGHTHWVSSLSLHPTLPFLLSSSLDGSARLWDYSRLLLNFYWLWFVMGYSLLFHSASRTEHLPQHHPSLPLKRFLVPSMLPRNRWPKDFWKT